MFSTFSTIYLFLGGAGAGFLEGLIAKAFEAASCKSPSLTYAGSAKEHACRIMTHALVDNQINGKAA